MKKVILLSLLFSVLIFNMQYSIAQPGLTVETATTFILSNESPGYLIDNLITNGHGNKNLYQVMQLLQPLSGGAIPQGFMDQLAACPSGSEIFTAALSNFAGLNNPVCVNVDGTLRINAIFGKDYFKKQGYSTNAGTTGPVNLKLFTSAATPDYYIDAGSGSGGSYKAFAIAWSLGSTLVLSNESPGYLIDNLVANGYGDKNIFEVLTALQPVSGGTIPLDFLNQLESCPAGSDLFTYALTNFSNFENNPICINLDGTLHVASIYGSTYYSMAGHSTFPGSQAGGGNEFFTYATSPEYYIDAGSGSSETGGNSYLAYAIIWSNSAVGIPAEESAAKSPYVYPNPFNDGFHIINLPEKTRLEIHDFSGHLVYRTEPKANSIVQPGKLSKGVYVLKLANSICSWQQMIVKY